MFKMVYANKNGDWFVNDKLEMVARLGNDLVLPDEAEMIEMPIGATLTMMPGRFPIGVNRRGEYKEFKDDGSGEEICAMAALLPQGFTRTLLPAVLDHGEELPILGYTAVGERDGKLYIAAIQTDEHKKWNPVIYNTEDLGKLIKERKAEFPENTIIKQLSVCAEEYGCFTAENMFYRRYEAGIPVSPVCNAGCIGCISLQESECCPSPQQRIKKAPKVEEVVEIAIKHLETAEQAIVSFGQGCEGEPSLQYELISEAIKKIREKTDKGIINMNTNAGCTKAIEAITSAGIDSLRVSMISANADIYEKYHRPKNYSFEDVCNSLEVARKNGTFVSLNLLAYPGLCDKEEELDAFIDLIDKYDIAQVQIRNLNIDSKTMTEIYGDYLGNSLGMVDFISCLHQACPDLIIGNYTIFSQKDAEKDKEKSKKALLL